MITTGDLYEFGSAPESIKALAERWYQDRHSLAPTELAELYTWANDRHADAYVHAMVAGKLVPGGAAIRSVEVALGWNPPEYDAATHDGKRTFLAVALCVDARRAMEAG